MRMYVKVMAAVIACILLSGEALSAFATTPATENLSWFKKKKKKSGQTIGKIMEYMILILMKERYFL